MKLKRIVKSILIHVHVKKKVCIMNMFIISCKLIKEHLHCHMNHYDTFFFQKFHRKRLYFCIRLPKMGKIRVVCLMNVIFTQRCSKFTENTMLDVDVLENNGNFWFEIVSQNTSADSRCLGHLHYRFPLLELFKLEARFVLRPGQHVNNM